MVVISFMDDVLFWEGNEPPARCRLDYSGSCTTLRFQQAVEDKMKEWTHTVWEFELAMKMGVGVVREGPQAGLRCRLCTLSRGDIEAVSGLVR